MVRAAKAYGDPTKDNHVSVGFANLSKQGEAGVTSSTLGADAKGNLFANSKVTIDSSVASHGGSQLDATVGHEGSHIGDAQDLVRSISMDSLGNFKVGQDTTQYQSEQRAYHVTDSILRAEGTHMDIACGFSPCSLGSTVVRGQVTNIVDQILIEAR